MRLRLHGSGMSRAAASASTCCAARPSYRACGGGGPRIGPSGKQAKPMRLSLPVREAHGPQPSKQFISREGNVYRSYSKLILDIWPGLVFGGAESRIAAAAGSQMSQPDAMPRAGAPSQLSVHPSVRHAHVRSCSPPRLGRPQDLAAGHACRIAAPIGCPPVGKT